MRQVLGNAIRKILDYFFALFHLIGDAFNFEKDRYENFLKIVRALFVVAPIFVGIIVSCVYYAGHPFVPTTGSVFGFEALKNFYIIDGIAFVVLLIAAIVLLILTKKGPDFMLAIRIFLFNALFIPFIIFCITNLYLLIALLVIVVLATIFYKVLTNGVPKDKAERKSVKDDVNALPPALGDNAYTVNNAGTCFRVKNRFRAKVYTDINGENVVASNSFGVNSEDFGLERDFRHKRLSLFDENDNLIDISQVRRVS